jgi:hypothetical protein
MFREPAAWVGDTEVGEAEGAPEGVGCAGVEEPQPMVLIWRFNCYFEQTQTRDVYLLSRRGGWIKRTKDHRDAVDIFPFLLIHCGFYLV